MQPLPTHPTSMAHVQISNAVGNAKKKKKTNQPTFVHQKLVDEYATPLILDEGPIASILDISLPTSF